MADEVAPAPVRGGMPRSFGAKLSYMLGPLLLFLVIGVGISFAIGWALLGKLEGKLKTRAETAEKVQAKLRTDLGAAQEQIQTEKDNVVKLNDEVKVLKKEKEELSASLEKAIGSLEVVSTTLQQTSKGLEDLQEYKKTSTQADQTQNNNIAANSRRIEYIEREVKDRFDKITSEMGQMKHVDVVLKSEYVALRNDLNTTMERGNVTESELNKLAERSKIFQLRVLTARAKEAEQAAREGDLKKLLVKLGEK